MSVRVGMVSLGCPKNQVDAELMLGRLADAGYDLVEDAAMADVAIVNTCGFIEDAKEESIEEILELVRMKNEGIIPKQTTGIDPAPNPAPTRGGESWGRAFLSPLTTHLSPLTTHHSPLTSHLSPLTSHHSPLTTHLSPLTTITPPNSS